MDSYTWAVYTFFVRTVCDCGNTLFETHNPRIPFV